MQLSGVCRWRRRDCLEIAKNATPQTAHEVSDLRPTAFNVKAQGKRFAPPWVKKLRRPTP
jgi:hypothetical protein